MTKSGHRKQGAGAPPGLCRAAGGLLRRLSLCAALFTACAPDAPEAPAPLPEDVWRRARAASPLPPAPLDETNRFDGDPAAETFGNQLFHAEILSPAGVSCAHCHPPEDDFATGEVRFSDRVARQVPSLWNVGHQRWFTWDGHKDSLWAQAIGPLEHAREMASDRLFVAHALAGDDALRLAFEGLFGPLPPLDDRARFPERGKPGSDPADPLTAAWQAMAPADREAVDEVLVNVGKALGAYQRTLRSGTTRFDAFVAAGLPPAGSDARAPDAGPSLQTQEVAGLVLFMGKARCHLCHSGPLFSDREFHNLGLPSIDPLDGDLGRSGGVDRVLRDPWNALSRHSDQREGEAADRVRYLRGAPEQEGQFKTPSLRNVARTAPYMHDGRFATLEEVVHFYSELPGAPRFGHREDTLQPLELSEEEIAALVAFLRALSDDP